jgi:hypothetical protein
MDTAELYMKNRINKQSLLKQNGWMDNTFEYSFNSKGFRCEEFTNNPTIMFLGCSYTCGIGLPVNNIWPEIVSRSLNLQCANMGQGGGSSDTAFRLCLGWIDQINPSIVIFLKPPDIRWELVSNDRINFLGVNTADPSNYVKEYTIDDNNVYFNNYKNNLAIESLCAQRNIKFLKFDSLPYIQDDYARDLSHPGFRTHQQFANFVVSKI